jgi:cellulose synthase/poly-beta-1,6-N-acetylglucosamine synthase-like glycosyltransferase
MELTARYIVGGGYLFVLFLVTFWLIVLFREKAGAANPLSGARETPGPAWPLVTVAIPAWNEASNIRQTMQSALALDYPHDRLELIVVNDGSRDQTEAIARQTAEENSGRHIRVLSQPNRGKGAALNTALRSASGEFFISMDADSLIKEDALQRMLPRFTDPSVAAVLPVMKVHDPRNLLQKIQWCEYLVSAFYKRLMATLDCISVVPGPFGFYRTQVLLALGGFDEQNITEDIEVTLRLQRHHYRIVQVFDTEVRTAAPATWRQFRRQRNRWYKGNFLNAWRYRRMALNRAYGDFGFIQMPRLIIELGLSLTWSWALVYVYVWRPLSMQLTLLWLTDFDVMGLLLDWLSGWDLIDVDWASVFFVALGLAVGYALVARAHRFAHEPVTRYGHSAIFAYLLLFPPLITAVYVGILSDLLRRRVQRW